MIRRARLPWASLLAFLLLIGQQGAWLHTLGHLRTAQTPSSLSAEEPRHATAPDAGHAHAGCSLCQAYSVFGAGAVPDDTRAVATFAAVADWTGERGTDRLFRASAPVYRSRAPPSLSRFDTSA